MNEALDLLESRLLKKFLIKLASPALRGLVLRTAQNGLHHPSLITKTIANHGTMDGEWAVLLSMAITLKGQVSPGPCIRMLNRLCQ